MASMPKTARDLTVSLNEDRPGILAKAAEAIASGGLNIDGFAEIEGILHVLTSDPASARRALELQGLSVSGEHEVVVLKMKDRPGVVAALFRRLAEAGINVRYTYVASGNRAVIAVDQTARAVEVLRS
jgi:hypothetical protein